jgi:hypothetical protein
VAWRGDREHARSEIRKVALHDEAGNHGEPEHGDVRQHRCEAEEAARQRRQQEHERRDRAQAVMDRELVAEKAGGHAEKTDQRTDNQNDPGLLGNIGLITRYTVAEIAISADLGSKFFEFTKAMSAAHKPR